MRSDEAGFTLLEVLVAMVILSLAVTTVLQLTSQSLRLLHRSGEHQRAVLLADRLLRQAQPDAERAESGREEPFGWARRAVRVAVPRELAPRPVTAPSGAAGSNREPELFMVSVVVSWGTRAVELSSLRAAVPQSALPRTP